VFSDEGPLDDYVDFLRRALEAAPYEYVTIELAQIEQLGDEEAFRGDLRAILAGIRKDVSKEAKERLVRWSGLREGRPFPRASVLLDTEVNAHEDDLWNHARLLGSGAEGSGLGRAVPWEQPPPLRGYHADAPGLVPVFAPTLEVLFTEAETERGRPLTDAEILTIRDGATCLMVKADSKFAAFAVRADDIDPARCVEAWRERRKRPQG
jgi:hypothetical protein